MDFSSAYHSTTASPSEVDSTTLQYPTGLLFSKSTEQPDLPNNSFPALPQEAGVTPAGTNPNPSKVDLTIHQHPVEKIQLTAARNRLYADEVRDCAVFGAHVGMRNKMERNILAQHQRLPGLVSNMVSLEAHLDLDEDLEFEDFLNPIKLNIQEKMGEKTINFREGIEETMAEIETRKVWNE